MASLGGGDEAVNEVRGEVSWVSPEGEVVSYTYVADENGYRPTNLPRAPAVPQVYSIWE